MPKYEGYRFGGRVSDDISQLDHARVPAESFQYFDLSFDFTFFDGLQHLDDYILAIFNGDSSVDF
jgi:hypothetical protein